jgi:hypothetical protein
MSYKPVYILKFVGVRYHLPDYDEEESDQHRTCVRMIATQSKDLFQKCILHLQPFVRAINRVHVGEPDDDEIENTVYKTAAEAELDVSMIAFQGAFNAFFVNEGIPVPPITMPFEYCTIGPAANTVPEHFLEQETMMVLV